MKNKSTFSCTEYQRLQIDFATFDTIVYFILKFKTKFFVEKNYRNVPCSCAILLRRHCGKSNTFVGGSFFLITPFSNSSLDLQPLPLLIEDLL